MEQYREQLVQTNLKVENISNMIAKVFSWLFFIVLLLALIGLLTYKVFISQDNLVINILLGLITIFSIVYGISFKNIKSIIYRYLFNKIKKFFLISDKSTQANSGS